MELDKRIKQQRKLQGLSQEELAGKVFVSRQTISNWETGKNYPDIRSLLLLSRIFNVSLDDLVKGDTEMMRKQIDRTEVNRFNRYTILYTVMLIVAVIAPILLFKLLGMYALIPLTLLLIAAGFTTWKLERIKRANDIHTYREIIAFTEGATLDEITRQREIGKRPYQTVLAVLAVAVIAVLIAGLLIVLIRAL